MAKDTSLWSHDGCAKCIAWRGAFGLSPDQLVEPAPSPYVNAQLDTVKAEPAVTRASNAAYTESRQQWLNINTALYWHIEHSLDLSGPERVRDEAKLGSFVAATGHLADGRGLYAWAISMARVDSLEEQTALTLDIGGARLKQGSTWVQFSLYVQGLHNKWALIATNANQSNIAFWKQLVITMPTEPAGAHLTQLRQWIATRIAELGRQDLHHDGSLGRIIDGWRASCFLVVLKRTLELVQGRHHVCVPLGRIAAAERDDRLKLSCVDFGILRVELAHKSPPRLEAIVMLDKAYDARCLLVVLGPSAQVPVDCLGVGQLQGRQPRDVQRILLPTCLAKCPGHFFIVHCQPSNDSL